MYCEKQKLDNDISSFIFKIYPVFWFLERVKRRLKRIDKKVFFYNDIENIEMATKTYQNIVGVKNV